MSIWLPDGRQTSQGRSFTFSAGMISDEPFTFAWPIPENTPPAINQVEATHQMLAILSKIHATLDAATIMQIHILRILVAEEQERRAALLLQQAKLQQNIQAAVKEQPKPPDVPYTPAQAAAATAELRASVKRQPASLHLDANGRRKKP